MNPDLKTMVDGVLKLAETYSPTDPVVQNVVATSVAMLECMVPADDPYLVALRAVQTAA